MSLCYNLSLFGISVTARMGQMQYTEILQTLKSLGNCKAVAGMTKFDINPKGAYGISIPSLRKLASAATAVSRTP